MLLLLLLLLLVRSHRTSSSCNVAMRFHHTTCSGSPGLNTVWLLADVLPLRSIQRSP